MLSGGYNIIVVRTKHKLSTVIVILSLIFSF